MAEKLKIKLSVANRVYPLTIHPSQEEGLRKASQEINDMIKQCKLGPTLSNVKQVIIQDYQFEYNNKSFNILKTS